MGVFKRISDFLIKYFFLKPVLPKKPFLPKRVKIKAGRKFNQRIAIFERKHHRQPNRNELIRIAINTSHICERRKSKKGHWFRQKISKHLLGIKGIHIKMR